jgi:O-acetyl-ADP-ribose deacetylase (regulator of RNase III)
MRGGPSVQKQLDNIGPLNMTESVVSSAGEMKANFIVHAVGPAFQEEELEEKLRKTILNALKEAEAKGISEIAFPPMGAGFYGVPLKESARITLSSVAEYLRENTNLKKVVICLLDNREFLPFQEELTRMTDSIKETV